MSSELGRYVTYTARNIPEHLYPKILDFDGEIFSEDADDFQSDTTMPRDVLMSYLKKNIDTTTIVYDKESDKVVGYFQAFPLKKNFVKDYISGDKTFKDITGDVIEPSLSDNPQSLYIWSVGITKSLRGKTMEDFNGALHNKKIYQVLLAEFTKSLINIIKSGANISSIVSEGVSKKGQTLSSQLTNNSIVHENKEEDFILYASEFNPENFRGLVSDELVDELSDAFNKQKNKAYQSSKQKLGDNLTMLKGINKDKSYEYDD